MPEILEVETARALLDARALHREIATVYAPDAWFLKRGLTPRAVRAALRGQTFTAARRRGRILGLAGCGRLGLTFTLERHEAVDERDLGGRLIHAGRCLIDGLGAQPRGRNRHDEAQAAQTETGNCERKPERTHDPTAPRTTGRLGWHLKLYML